MRVLMVGLLLTIASQAAHAEGETFMVLPTEAWGDVEMKARHVAEMMRIALVERSLQTTPAPSKEDLAAGEFGVTCSASADACAQSVGRERKATKVIGSSLRELLPSESATGLELELSFYDIRTGAIARRKSSTGELPVLVDWAQGEALAFAGVEVTGGLVITGLPVGTRVFADDVEKAQLPMLAPIKLRPGRHAIVLKTADAAGSSFVDVKADETLTVKRCVNGALIDDCGATKGLTPAGPNALLIGGGVGVGLGVVALVVSAGTAVASSMSYDAFLDEGDSADLASTKSLGVAAVASAVVGGTLLVAGGAVAAASLMME